MRSHVVGLSAAFALAIMAVPAQRADAAHKASAVDVGACWRVDMATTGGRRQFRLTLAAAGERLFGALADLNVEVPINGTIKGDEIAVEASIPIRAMLPTHYKLAGKIQGDKISGTTSIDDQGAIPFTATRNCPAGPSPNDIWSAMPKAWDFNDHEGFVSIFDGTLKGWDGNLKFWRAEKGMIVGESTPENPSGNAYLTYRDLTVHDFDLRMEIMLTSGGSGIQYRSHTGTPWRSPTPSAVEANVGKYNPDQMLTGPQADIWSAERARSFSYTGQVYLENLPAGIEAFTGQVVRQYGQDAASKKQVATIAPTRMLTGFINIGAWNQYEVIARGGVFLHIINGQLMAVLIDDDPNSPNQAAGLFGLELESNAKIMARNIYVRKLN